MKSSDLKPHKLADKGSASPIMPELNRVEKIFKKIVDGIEEFAKREYPNTLSIKKGKKLIGDYVNDYMISYIEGAIQARIDSIEGRTDCTTADRPFGGLFDEYENITLEKVLFSVRKAYVAQEEFEDFSNKSFNFSFIDNILWELSYNIGLESFICEKINNNDRQIAEEIQELKTLKTGYQARIRESNKDLDRV